MLGFLQHNAASFFFFLIFIFVTLHLILTVIQKHKVTPSYPFPKSGSGDCSTGKICKDKNFSVQKQSSFLILMHRGANISISEANHCYMQINKTVLIILL